MFPYMLNKLKLQNCIYTITAKKGRSNEEKSGKTRLDKAKNANETDDLYSIYDRATKKYGYGTWPFISAH